MPWNEGPLLQSLTHRLAECPADFLADPKVRNDGVVDVLAVVSDLLREFGAAPPAGAKAGKFGQKDDPQSVVQVNRLKLILVASWLLHDPWFRKQGAALAAGITDLLVSGFDALAELVEAGQFVVEADRREEFARHVLAALELRPRGETDAQARDLLDSISSVERRSVVEESRKAQERAERVRKAMAEKAAKEAAAKVSRE